MNLFIDCATKFDHYLNLRKGCCGYKLVRLVRALEVIAKILGLIIAFTIINFHFMDFRVG